MRLQSPVGRERLDICCEVDWSLEEFLLQRMRMPAIDACASCLSASCGGRVIPLARSLRICSVFSPANLPPSRLSPNMLKSRSRLINEFITGQGCRPRMLQHRKSQLGSAVKPPAGQEAVDKCGQYWALQHSIAGDVTWRDCCGRGGGG